MKVFGCDYQFLSCGNVFTVGLMNAAAELGIEYAHALWSDPALPAKIAAFDPDLVLVVHGRRYAEQWRHEKGMRFDAVWLLDEPYEVDDTSGWSSLFGAVFICDPNTLHRHAERNPRRDKFSTTYLPVCYDPVVHHYTPGAERPHALGFIAGGNSVRERYLGTLARAGALSYVVGGPWSDPEVEKRSLSLNIAPAATSALYQATRIVLNVWRERHHFNRSAIPAFSMNPRVYEATACGALVVSEWRPEVDVVCPDLPTFHTPEEAVSLVQYLLAHPDEAEAIRLKVAASLAAHTYAARLRTVVERCGFTL